MTRASLAAILLLTACAAGTTGTGGSGGSTGGGAGGSTGGGTGGATGGGTGGSTGGGTGGSTGGGTGGSGGGNSACTADGGVPGSASKCGCGGFILCEDFEAAAIDTATWTAANNGTGNTVALDSTRAARGAKSLRVTVKGNAGSTATLSTAKVTGHASFFGRAFVYAPAPIPIVHTGIFEASGGNVSMRLGIDHMRDIEPNYFGAMGEKGIFTSGKTKLPTDKWVCLEWEYRSTGEYHFFLDGTEMQPIKVIPGTDNWPAAAWTKFSLGLTMYQGDTATAPSFEFWFDEVALSTTRITCNN